MGLLTGFSFISAVEILYFMLKITLKMMRERKIIKTKRTYGKHNLNI